MSSSDGKVGKLVKLIVINLVLIEVLSSVIAYFGGYQEPAVIRLAGMVSEGVGQKYLGSDRHPSWSLELTQREFQLIKDAPDIALDNVDDTLNGLRRENVISKNDETNQVGLEANLDIVGIQLRSKNRYNWEPPIMYVINDAPVPAELQKFIEKNELRRYRYTTGPDGFRRTVPEVRSSKKIAVIGDSVAFGYQVNDHETIASHLQKLVGSEYQVINMARPAIPMETSAEMAKWAGENEDIEFIVYVACFNDLVDGEHKYSASEYRQHFGDELLGHFKDKLVVLFTNELTASLQPFLNYTDPALLEGINESKKVFQSDVTQAGSAWLDFDVVFDQFIEDRGFHLSGFQLYVDMVHLSPVGSQLAASFIHRSLRSRK